MLGGAVGDALGWPVEFDSIDRIRQRFGTDGIVAPIAAERSGLCEVTDDTQMTLFTAEGYIRALVRAQGRGMCHTPSVVWFAYRRWYRTQTEPFPGADTLRRERPLHEAPSFLLLEPALWHRRAPGNTCISALARKQPPTIAENTSKGCGTVMKTAPIGLLTSGTGHDEAIIGSAAEIAFLTHGHPMGALAAGLLADIIALLVLGSDVHWAIRDGRRNLSAWVDARQPPAIHQLGLSEPLAELLALLERVLELHASKQAVTPELIEQTFGGGWIAEEALAIGLLCALRAETFEEGVRMAVNHSGDSDSTGAIAGNLLGLVHGVEAIPPAWLERLELKSIIEDVADDLLDAAVNGVPCPEGPYSVEPLSERDAADLAARQHVYDRWFAKYPGC